MAYSEITETLCRLNIPKFKARVREKNKHALVKSKSKTFRCKNAAQTWASQTEKQLEAQLHPKIPEKILRTNFDNTSHADVNENSTIEQLITAFIEMSSKGQNSYCKSYINALSNIRKYEISYLKPSELNWGYLVSYCQERSINGAKPATIAIDISALTSTLKTMTELFKHNFNYEEISALRYQLKNFGYIGESNIRIRRLSFDEERAIKTQLANKSKQATINYVVMFELYKLTCVRRAGLTNLTWEDIDWERGLIRVYDGNKGNRLKAARPRFIPITDDINKQLQLLKQNKMQLTGKIFPIKPGTVTSAFVDAVKLAKIEDYRLHDLRTEGASQYLELGLTVKEVSVFTGHQDLHILHQIYGQIRASKVGHRTNLLKKLIQEAHSENSLTQLNE